MRRALALLLCLAVVRLAPAAVSVRDDTGAEVRLDRPAQRIVTLAPHAAELVYAAGAGGALVATVEHSDEPTAARAVPRLGGLAGIDRERLLAAQPDLVVAWASGNPPGLLAWLERRSIPVYRSEPRRLADVGRSIADIARLAGLPPAAPAAAPIVAVPSPPVTALFLFWDDPPIVAGADHVLTDLLWSCGATPAVPGLRGKSAVLSREALLAARPDLVFTTDGRVLVDSGSGDASAPLAELRVGADERHTLAATQRPGPRLNAARAAVCHRVSAAARAR